MDRGPADARHHRLIGLAGAALAAWPGAALAEERLATEKGVLSLAVENDSLSSGADRNYTSGIKLAYVSPEEALPGWLRAAGAFTRPLSGNDADFWGVALGQSIFTPQDIAANPAPSDQHPYAGWLYAQIMVAVDAGRGQDGRLRHLDTYELEFGMVGPSALGKPSQRGIHEWLGAPDPQGWDSELRDEFAFALSFDRRWRALARFEDVGGLEADLTPSAGLTLGTLRDEVRLGLGLRVGQHLADDYGPPRVRPSLSGVEHFERAETLSWSVFTGVMGRAVAHNLFLDGNTYRDGPSVERNPYVFDFQSGISVSAGDWRLAYTFVWRSEEFASQPARQDFGALALSWRL
jgi:lipid A 3-O-deacylase